jgi:hypothetical protein
MLVSCPNCSVKLDVPDEFQGRKVRCATCSSVFEARAGTDGPPPLPLPGKPPAPAAEEMPPPRPDRGEDDRHTDHDRHDRAHDDLDDDDFEDSGPSRRRRHIRRDLEPHRGNLILGLGIGSIVSNVVAVCCIFPAIVGVPLGIVSLMLGLADVRKMDAGDMDPDGRGSTTAGYICAIIGLVFGVLTLVRCLLTIFGMAAFMAMPK